jgi:hypothetical protein
MKGIFDLLAIRDHEVSTKTLEALIEIVKLNYLNMGPYLERLLNLTQTFMSAPEPDDVE